jgi:predicted O-methyltransferase YrrM
MKLFPLFNTDGSSTCPLGMPMNQNRLAIPVWSYAMEVLPPARIVELGSYNGGMTIALGLHAYHIGARVVSYERSKAPDQRYVKLAAFLGIEFRDRVDLWECDAEIAEIIQGPGATFVLCDAGDKPRELAVFARYLKPGDVIAAHDFDAGHDIGQPIDERPWPYSEIRREDGARVAADCNLSPWMQDYFSMAGWLAYRKNA